MMSGMLVPILAAAPFYVADRRAEQKRDEEQRQREESAD